MTVRPCLGNANTAWAAQISTWKSGHDIRRFASAQNDDNRGGKLFWKPTYYRFRYKIKKSECNVVLGIKKLSARPTKLGIILP